jgi:phosphoglycolate phosphatase-like HAD superfamily hydrolase
MFPRNRLILFDIDGTLLSASSVPARILGEALTEVFGTPGAAVGFEYSGKTDPQIARELMRGAGVGEERIAKDLPEALSRYLDRLATRLAPEHVKAKPGVGPLLDRLAAEPEVTLGLLTGNLEPGARLKLAPLDLNRYFPFGAYGSDNEDRYALPPLAVERAHARTGLRFMGQEVVIVGDSIHDVLCGRSIGVRAVAVSTGPTPKDRLRASGPHALLDDFSDTEAALRALLNGAAA